MPYKSTDELPENIQKLPANQQKKWMEVFNSVYYKCDEDGGDECEAQAFKQANGVIADMSIDIADSITHPINLQFIELTAAMLTADKPFDGLAAGEFTDMHGRAVKITAADLAAIVTNTNALLESTRGENGDLAGLPIDEMRHEKGHASGWIVGVELVGEVLRIIPQWTSIGRDLIANKIQKYFSATVDLAKKVIYGGTLTNWPATRDGKTGRVLLRPIELSQELLQIEQETAENETPVPEKKQEKKPMKLDELTQEERDALLSQARQDVLSELAPKTNANETDEQRLTRLRKELNLEAFANLTDLSQVTDALTKNMEEVLTAELQRVDEMANRRLAQMMADRRKVMHIAEFAQFVTSGTDKHPRALPVGREEIETMLSDLPEKSRAAVESILKRTVESGLTEFSELGHGRTVKQGTLELAEPIKAQLKNWIKEGNSVEEFFAINGEFLGDQDAYNLSEFTQKEK